ncbi:mCG53639 [Mus musculus]|nr:mCG53639 [Mus musculus]
MVIMLPVAYSLSFLIPDISRPSQYSEMVRKDTAVFPVIIKVFDVYNNDDDNGIIISDRSFASFIAVHRNLCLESYLQRDAQGNQGPPEAGNLRTAFDSSNPSPYFIIERAANRNPEASWGHVYFIKRTLGASRLAAINAMFSDISDLSGGMREENRGEIASRGSSWRQG